MFTCQHKLCSRWEIIKIHSLSHLASTCEVFCNIFRSHVVYMYYIKRFRGLYQRRGGITWMLAFRRRAGSSSSGGGWICDYYYRDMCAYDLFLVLQKLINKVSCGGVCTKTRNRTKALLLLFGLADGIHQLCFINEIGSGMMNACCASSRVKLVSLLNYSQNLWSSIG